jgi:hypothetical protein
MADVNMEDEAETAMDLAVEWGHHEDINIVKILRDAPGGRSSIELRACT